MILPCCLLVFFLTQHTPLQVQRDICSTGPSRCLWPPCGQDPHLAATGGGGGVDGDAAEDTWPVWECKQVAAVQRATANRVSTCCGDLPCLVRRAMIPALLSGLYSLGMFQNCPLMGKATTADYFCCSLLPHWQTSPIRDM